MPVSSITGKQCTFTYGALDASAQITSVGPARSKSAEVTETLGETVTSSSSTEITVALELLFDPNDAGISALLHAAWVGQGEGTLEIDYGGAVATYAKVKVTELSEAVPADGLVTQSATFTTGDPDTFIWKTAATQANVDEAAAV